MGVLRRDADVIGVLERAYAPASDHDVWSRDLAQAAREIFARGLPVGLVGVQHSADCASVQPMFSQGVFTMVEARRQMRTASSMGETVVRAIFFPPSILVTHSSIEGCMSAPQRAVLASLRASYSIEDAVGLVVHPSPGVVAVLFVGTHARVTLSGREARTLTQLALHIEAALRLRLRPELVRAVLDPTGKVVHLEPGVRGVGRLATIVKRIDAGRGRRRRSHPQPLDLWSALAGGSASLVQRTEGSRRLYFIIENAPERQPMRALTPMELDVVAGAARGLSGKMIGYGLGISESTVSSSLSRAALKIGLARRTELVRIAAMLTHHPRASFADVHLTPAEREVLDLLTRGLSNDEIAAARGRSIRTIANQVASLLTKTRSSNRRALVARPRSG